MTKFNYLRLVHIIVKIEYYLTDDIYLCGIIVPHYQNKHALMLIDNNGLFLSQNEKSEQILGRSVNLYPYSMYCLIPGLFKLI